MAKGPVKSGVNKPRPPAGKNGPNGTGGGTKKYAPPMPAPKKQGFK